MSDTTAPALRLMAELADTRAELHAARRRLATALCPMCHAPGLPCVTCEAEMQDEPGTDRD